MKRWIGKKGFSLVEIMVAAGLLAALSLVIMNISKEGAVVQKRSETAFEINTISNIIAQVLLNTDACSSTLGVGTNISNGKVITEIRNRNNNPIYNTTDRYGNNTVQIQSMTLRDLNLAGNPGDPERSGEVVLEVTFEKMSKVVTGQKTVPKQFFLNIQVDSADNLIKCHSAIENAVATAKQLTCESIGGTFDLVTENCNLRNFDPSDALANHLAVSTQHLRDAFNHRVTNELDPKYVDVTGDTMTGKLTVNNEIESNNTLTANRVNSATQVCVGGRCRNFNQAPCPTGQVVRTINEDGTVVCANITCPPNTYFAGINGAGSPTCNPLPTETCPINQYISEVQPNGTIVCATLPNNANSVCSPGQYIEAIVSGVPTCKTLPPDTNTNVFGQSCAAGEILRGFNALGAPICDPAPAAGFTTCTMRTKIIPGSGGSVSCLSDETLTGGGCLGAGGSDVTASGPSGNSFHCSGAGGNWSVRAICCK